jgi:hypothetical protein
MPIVYGQLRVPIRIINGYVTNETQYDEKWASTSPTITRSGYVETFSVSSAEGIKLYIKPRICKVQTTASFFTYFAARARTTTSGIIYDTLATQQIKRLRHVPVDETINTASYTYYFLPYKVEYKKSTDSQWTEWGWYVPNYGQWQWFIGGFRYNNAMWNSLPKNYIEPLIVQFTAEPNSETYNVRVTMAGENVDSLPTENSVRAIETLDLNASSPKVRF